MKAADVPCWMFIGWINQMLAVLDKREGKAVHSILQEIAQTYPQVRDNLHTVAKSLLDKCLVSVVKHKLHQSCP